jgi:hypothetical protein
VLFTEATSDLALIYSQEGKPLPPNVLVSIEELQMDLDAPSKFNSENQIESSDENGKKTFENHSAKQFQRLVEAIRQSPPFYTTEANFYPVINGIVSAGLVNLIYSYVVEFTFEMSKEVMLQVGLGTALAYTSTIYGLEKFKNYRNAKHLENGCSQALNNFL